MSKIAGITLILFIPLFLILSSYEKVRVDKFYIMDELNYTKPVEINTHTSTLEANSISSGGKDVKKGGWELVFFDDFTNVKLNKRNWTVLDRLDNYNNELQAYTSQNIEVKDERLLLIAKKDDSHPKKYTSGLVKTKRKFDFLYGKVEVKGRYPVGKGLFPAIWMLRADDKDHLPEIDILESVGHEPNLVYQVHHWRKDGNTERIYNIEEIDNLDEDHIYGIEWDEDEIRWYIDNQLVFSSVNNIPDMPMYLIINLAVGGNWPGSPDQNTTFPALFSIDYVKIYKRVGNG